MRPDIGELAAGIVRQIVDYVEREISPLRERVKSIEALPSPRDGRDGRDAAGVDGKDGRDGLGFDDLTVDYDGERQVTFRFVQGERTREFPICLPIVIDRGVFREADAYERGDGVTWGGSFWIAQEATREKPESGKGWRLAVKRGRDGRDHPAK